VLPTRDRSPGHSLALNASAVVVGEAISRIAAATAFVLLSRVFTPDVYGLLAFAASLTALAMPVVDFGLVTVAGAEVARERHTAGDVLGRVWRIRLALAAASAAVITAFSAVAGLQHLFLVSVIYAAGLFPTALSSTWLAQTLGHPMLFALEKAIQSFALLALVLFAMSAGATPWMIAAAVLVSTVVAVGVATCLSLRTTGVKPIWQPGGERELARQAVPVFLAILPLSLLIPAAGLAVGWLQGMEDLGHFWLAARLLIGGALIGNAVWSSAFPLVSAGHHDRAWQLDTVGDLLWRTLAIGMAGSWLTIVASPVLTSWIFGPLYAGAAPLVRWTGPIITAEAAALVLVRLMPVFGNARSLPRTMSLGVVAGLGVFAVAWRLMGLEAFMAAILAVHVTVLAATLIAWPSSERRRLASPPVWLLSALAAALVIESVVRGWPMDLDVATWVRMIIVLMFSAVLIWTRLRRPLRPGGGSMS
jgi:O-antigen/teichoic acid export membrane protein